MRRLRARGVSSVIACCLALAACGSTGAPSGTVTNSGSVNPSVRDAGLRFASCMRSRGVSNFPDPGAGGGINISPASGINPQSPAFQTAQRACKSFLPKGIGHPPTATAAQKRAALAFAQCMRSHGEPNFPDPANKVSSATPILALHGMLFPVGPGLDPNAPAFRRVAAACGVH
jgi:hypothetical protein